MEGTPDNSKKRIKKSTIIISVILLIILAGLIFIILGFKSQPLLYLVPKITFEATVISATLYPEHNYSLDKNFLKPADYALVKIDKIIKVDKGSNDAFDGSSIGIVEGNQVNLSFDCSLRPTKIISIPGETTQDGHIVSHTITPTTINFEEGYFVIRTNGDKVKETVLPGLKEGSRFRAYVFEHNSPQYMYRYQDSFSKLLIGEYTLVTS